jgi:hypothetical protein
MKEEGNSREMEPVSGKRPLGWKLNSRKVRVLLKVLPYSKSLHEGLSKLCAVGSDMGIMVELKKLLVVNDNRREGCLA